MTGRTAEGGGGGGGGMKLFKKLPFHRTTATTTTTTSTTTNTKQEEEDATNIAVEHPIPYQLPKETDRIATLGCLAVVLNIIATTTKSTDSDTDGNLPVASSSSSSSSSSSKLKSKSKSNSSSSTKHRRSSLGTKITTNTDTNKDEKNEDTESSRTTTTRRTKEFQKELLMTSAELLFLDRDVYARQYLPILTTATTTTTTTNNNNNNIQLLLDPFLSSLSTAEAGFQCVSLLLFRFLVLSNNTPTTTNTTTGINNNSNDNDDTRHYGGYKSIIGYDARVRYAFKYLAVSILKYFELQQQQEEEESQRVLYNANKRDADDASSLWCPTSSSLLSTAATRKFEDLEDTISHRLSIIAKQIAHELEQQQRQSNSNNNSNNTNDDTTIADKSKAATAHSNNPLITKLRMNMQHKTRTSVGKNITRGLKVGGAAIGAATVIAISGGIMVPFVVGSIATLAGITASFAAVAGISILLLPATIAVFGVGSGLLVASKMSKRTKGLTEFTIEHHAYRRHNQEQEEKEEEEQQLHPSSEQPKLCRTICINGWITDAHDFERPFGVTPKLLTDKKELLRRFCSVYAPEVIPRCTAILQEWHGQEDELWELLKDTYGTDPDSLLPLNTDGCNLDESTTAKLTTDETQTLDSMIGHIMGVKVVVPSTPTTTDEIAMNKHRSRLLNPVSLLDDVLSTSKNKTKTRKSGTTSKKGFGISGRSFRMQKKDLDDDDDDTDNDNIVTNKKYKSCLAWDFQSTYRGMELYTVLWEKELLMEMRGLAYDLQMSLASKSVEYAIKKTIFASLMSAVALPATLLGLTNFIDEKWTLSAERADEAGILLAESLLQSEAGNRPVNLIGVSFGARVVVSCLTELARQQTKWEQQQQQHEAAIATAGKDEKDGRRFSMNDIMNSSTRRSSSAVLSKAGKSIRKSIHASIKASSSSSSSSLKGQTTRTDARMLPWKREPASIVENVVLMGGPVSLKPAQWLPIRAVVAGTLSNCYCEKDLLLALMYRLKNPTQLFTPPIGITRIPNSTTGGGGNVTNCNVSSLIANNHGDYRLAVRDILARVGFDEP